MSLAYLDITELKNERADAGKYLRWVESKLSWYQSSPTSIASGDDDLVVTPTLGVGRWLKQKSSKDVAQGLTPSILTTSISVDSNTKNYCDTTSGSITITLPASPSTGNLISIFALAGTSYTNKIVINPNGNTINGVSGNREITILREFADLEFASGFGWVIKSQSNTNTLKFPMTSYSVNAPLLADTPSYLGIIDYLGKQKNTTTYLNPHSTHSGTRTKRISLATDSSAATSLIDIPTILFSKNPTGNTFLDTQGIADTFGSSLLLDFTTLGLARLSKIQFGMPNVSFSSRFSGVRIYGANTSGISGYTLDTVSRNRKLETCFSDLKLLSNLTNTFDSSNWKLTGSSQHTLLDVDAVEFYRYYILNFNNGRYTYINQLELFGDILTA